MQSSSIYLACLWTAIMTYFITPFHYAIYCVNWNFMTLKVYERFFKHVAYTRINPLRQYILDLIFML